MLHGSQYRRGADKTEFSSDVTGLALCLIQQPTIVVGLSLQHGNSALRARFVCPRWTLDGLCAGLPPGPGL